MIALFVSTLLLAPPPAAPPAPPPTRAKGEIGEADYPAASLRNHEQGLVRVRVTVTPQGRVSACTVIASSGFPNLDAGTCRLFLTRVRYSPARDDTGQPVEDIVEEKMTWRID
jgi:protein TonB